MTVFAIKDEFIDPRTFPLKTLREEYAAGNPYAALWDMWFRLGGYERGLEDKEFAIGFDNAFRSLTMFLADHLDPKHSAYPLLIAAHGLIENNDSKKGPAVDRRANLLRVVTKKVVEDVLALAEQGSYHGKILGSMLVGASVHVERNYEKSVELIESLPGFSGDPPTSNDPSALYEQAQTYAAMAQPVAGYSAAQKAIYFRKFCLCMEAAANLGNILVMPQVAGYYLQKEDGISYLPEIADPVIRAARAERLARSCVDQGVETAKTILANVLEEKGDLETAEADKRRYYDEAKKLYQERTEAGDAVAALALIGLHDRLGEQVEANNQIPKAFAAAVANNNEAIKAKTLVWLYVYHSGEEVPGIERSDRSALMASEAILNLHNQEKYSFQPGQKSTMEAVSKSLWARAWIRDEKQGFRRARKTARPIPAKSIPFERYVKLYGAWKNNSDDAIDGIEKFFILSVDPKEALRELFTEAQTATAITLDLASDLLNRAQIWVRDAEQTLRLATKAEDIIKNTLVHAILLEDPAEALSLLLAETQKAGAVISSSLTSEIAKLYGQTGDADQARHWQFAAAERNSVPDMQAILARFYESGPEQDWDQAKQWAQRILDVPYKDGGLRNKPRSDVEKIQKEIVRTEQAAAEQVATAEMARRVKEKEAQEKADREAAAEMAREAEAQAAAAEAARVAAINKAEAIATGWITAATTQQAEEQAAAEAERQAELQAAAAEATRVTAINEAEAAATRWIEAAIAQQAVVEKAARQAAEKEAQEEADRQAAAEAERQAAEQAAATLARHVAAANTSIPDALEAARLYFELGQIEQSEDMYALAIQSSDFDTVLEVAERHAGIKNGAARDMEIALHLYNLVGEYNILPADQPDASARFDALLTAILPEAWTENEHGILVRVHSGIVPDMQPEADQPLVVLCANQESLDYLLERRRVSMDAAAEAALRLARGTGCNPDLSEAFRQLSNLLLDRKQISPRLQTAEQEPDPELRRDYPFAIIPAGTKRNELQIEWDRLASLVVRERVLKNGNAVYRMQDSSEVWTIRSENATAYEAHRIAGECRHQKTLTVEAG